MRKRMMIRSLSAAMVLSVILGAAFWAWAELDDDRFPLPEAGQIRHIGVVNRVENDKIVINDRLYRLLPTTACYTSAMDAGSIHLFHPDDRVGFIANPRMEVLHLWLLPKQ